MTERDTKGSPGAAVRMDRLAGAFDADSLLTQSGWHREPEPLDEAAATPGAQQGWHSWNEMSPEVEICDFIVSLADVLRPELVIETGTGQGFLTRRIGARLRDDQRLVCYESHAEWRAALTSLEFFDGIRCVLAPDESPDDEAMAAARLCLLDSDFAFRLPEIQRWWRCARPGAAVFVHDAGNGHGEDTPHALVRATIIELGIPGIFLGNPRGAFVGQKPPVGGPSSVATGTYVANRLVELEAELRTLRATKTFRYTAGARRVYGELRKRLSAR